MHPFLSRIGAQKLGTLYMGECPCCEQNHLAKIPASLLVNFGEHGSEP